MHSPLSTRITHAFNAARPARRHVARALRHHTARTRALAEQLRDVKPVYNVRTWFRTFFSALSLQGASRRFSLRTLRHTPAAWLMQNGTEPWQTACYLRMSVETLLRV